MYYNYYIFVVFLTCVCAILDLETNGMNNLPFEIDLIYLWVDGDDPKWLAKKRAYTGSVDDGTEANNKGRYANNDELRYSLRSAAQHVPWIRRIFIVTDNQTPGWLDTSHPKIQRIDHTEILPPESLPCFNSSVIEYFLHKIPDLSEHFLFANDDMFFNADLQPDFFYKPDGCPIVRLKRKQLSKWRHRIKSLAGKQLGQYARMVLDSALLIERKFGKYYPGVPHHNVDAYRKSDYRRAVEEVFSTQIQQSQTHRIRTTGDIHRSAFAYYVLAIGRGHLKYVGRKESGRILVHKHDFSRYLNRYRSKLFCLNDSQRVKDSDREKIRPFLEDHFSTPSVFEK